MYGYEYVRSLERERAAWLASSSDVEEPYYFRSAPVLWSDIRRSVPEYGTFRPNDWRLADVCDLNDPDTVGVDFVVKHFGDVLGGFAIINTSYLGYFTQDDEIEVNPDMIQLNEDKFSENHPTCPLCGQLLYDIEEDDEAESCTSCSWDKKENIKKADKLRFPYQVGDVVDVWVSLFNTEAENQFEVVEAEVTKVHDDGEINLLRDLGFLGTEESWFVDPKCDGMVTKLETRQVWQCVSCFEPYEGDEEEPKYCRDCGAGLELK